MVKGKLLRAQSWVTWEEAGKHTKDSSKPTNTSRMSVSLDLIVIVTNLTVSQFLSVSGIRLSAMVVGTV